MNIFLRDLTPLDRIVAGSVFGLVLAVWLIVFFTWYVRRSRQKQAIEGRLGLTEEEKSEGGTRTLRLWHEGKVSTIAVPGEGKRLSLKERIAKLSVESELEGELPSLLLAVLGAASLGFLLLFTATQRMLPGIALVIALAVGLRLYINWRIGRRQSKFERQFVDALDLAARSLRSGHPLLGAFRLIAEEIPPPVSTVFHEVCQRQALGVSLEQALQQTSREYPSDDLRLFVASVIIQLRSGGNLADMMERIAAIIRDRMRLSRKVRTLTAQTQLSKRVLIALPFFMFFLLNILNPKYMETFYTTTAGQIMLAIAGAGIILGTYMMNKIAVLRY